MDGLLDEKDAAALQRSELHVLLVRIENLVCLVRERSGSDREGVVSKGHEASMEQLLKQWPTSASHGSFSASLKPAAFVLELALLLWLLAEFDRPRLIAVLRKRFDSPPSTLDFAVSRLRSSPIHRALEVQARRETLLELIKWGFSVDCVGISQDKQTPLHVAVFMDRQDAVEDLLRAGASLTKVDFQLSTPLHIAAGNSRVGVGIIQLLLDNISRRIDKNELMNARDKDGDTPLHLATIRGGSNPQEFMKMLLSYGANPNVQNKKSETPLHMGIRHEDLVVLLLEYGADPNIQDARGRTPLHECVYGIHASSILSSKLMSKGANPYIQDDKGNTPLDLAQGSRIGRTLLVDEETIRKFQEKARSLRKDHNLLLSRSQAKVRMSDSSNSEGRNSQSNEAETNNILLEKPSQSQADSTRDTIVKELTKKLKYLEKSKSGTEREKLKLCRELGRIHYERGMFRHALKYHMQELKLALSDSDKMTAYRNTGSTLHLLGMFEESVKYYEECLAICLRVNNTIYIQRAYSSLASVYIDYATQQSNITQENYTNALQKADEFSNKSLEAITALRAVDENNNEWDLMETRCLINSAMILTEMKEYDNSLQRLLSAIQIAEKVKDAPALESGYTELGNVYLHLNQYDEALRYFEKMYAIVKKKGNPLSMCNALINLGSIHYELGKFQKSLELHDRAKVFAAQVDDQENTARRADNAYSITRLLIETSIKIDLFYRSHNEPNQEAVVTSFSEVERIYIRDLHKEFACLLEDNQRYGRACTEFERAIQLATENEHSFLLSSLVGLGECHRSVGRLEKALDAHKKQLHVAELAGLVEEQASAYCYLGGILLLNGVIHDAKTALEYFEKALQLSKISAHVDIQIESLENIARILNELGRTEESQACTQELKLLEDAADSVEDEHTKANGGSNTEKSFTEENEKSNQIQVIVECAFGEVVHHLLFPDDATFIELCKRIRESFTNFPTRFILAWHTHTQKTIILCNDREWKDAVRQSRGKYIKLVVEDPFSSFSALS